MINPKLYPMKKTILIFSIAFMINACTNEDYNDLEPDLVGNWKMVGYLSDPGDGSGTYADIESKKTINFLANGTFTSSGSLCQMLSSENENSTSGNYNLSSLNVSAVECNNQSDLNLRYEISGDSLFLFYPCREACYVKYEKQ